MNFAIGLIGVLAVLSGIMLVGIASSENFINPKWNTAKKRALITIVGIILVMFSFSFKIIPTGYTGVRTTFGQISSQIVQNGFNWKIPFVQNIGQVNNKQQDITFDNKVWSETSERTAIFYKNITVTYQINHDKSAWIYANVSDYKDSLVSQSLVASAIKSSSKALSDTDATARSKIESLSMGSIQNALDEKYGKNVVLINKVVISNADFEKSYNNAIAKKQEAQLESEEQAIVNQKNIDKAKADATAKLTEAEAEAKANKKLEGSLTDKVLQNSYISKWDGKMPSVMTSKDGSIMIGTNTSDK